MEAPLYHQTNNAWNHHLGHGMKITTTIKAKQGKANLPLSPCGSELLSLAKRDRLMKERQVQCSKQKF